MLRGLILLLIAGLGAWAADLPVKKIVLYKHGVGYFERAGELGPGESARLAFKASEMNDVLKSLTLTTSGGKVVALRYDASEPLRKRLAKFSLNLKDNQPLSYLLDQLKGEQVELNLGTKTVTGAILGAHLQPATADQAEREQVTLLTSTGDIVTLDLSAASSIRFPDPKLELQLKDYLGVLRNARSHELRSVYIDSTDTGRRRITASYMIPAPVWKSSYRLIFTGKGEPTLEGWAIVDNTTGDDWIGVNLSLVSGRPISFVSKLYEPRYVRRPVAELPEEKAQAPVVHGGVIGDVFDNASGMGGGIRKKTGNKVSSRAFRPAMAAEMAAPPPPAPRPMTSTMAPPAGGRELGELFEYRFDKPVTVRKNASAMLGFLQQKISARKLLIYQDRHSRHPLNAAELTNSTGKTLDGGPITVFDAGAYAGEALMETLKAGDKRLISYGIDLGTRITTAFDSERLSVREVHFRRGVLSATSAVRETRTYTIRNVDQKAKTLLIEHPARPGYRLIGTTPAEKTENAYRFEVKLAAGATVRFPVTEERTLSNTYALTNQTPELLASFVQNKKLSEEARRQLGQILEQKRSIAAEDAKIRQLETEIRELGQDQERIRKNISSLSRVSGQQTQVQRYAAQLAQQEARMAELRDNLSKARKTKTDLQAALNRMVDTIEF